MKGSLGCGCRGDRRLVPSAEIPAGCVCPTQPLPVRPHSLSESPARALERTGRGRWGQGVAYLVLLSCLKDTTGSHLAPSFGACGPWVPPLRQIRHGGPSPALTTVLPPLCQLSPEPLTEGRAGVPSTGGRCSILRPPRLLLTHRAYKRTASDKTHVLVPLISTTTAGLDSGRQGRRSGRPPRARPPRLTCTGGGPARLFPTLLKTCGRTGRGDGEASGGNPALPRCWKARQGRRRVPGCPSPPHLSLSPTRSCSQSRRRASRCSWCRRWSCTERCLQHRRGSRRLPHLGLQGRHHRWAPQAARGLTHHSDADSQCGLLGDKRANLSVPCSSPPFLPCPRLAQGGAQPGMEHTAVGGQRQYSPGPAGTGQGRWQGGVGLICDALLLPTGWKGPCLGELPFLPFALGAGHTLSDDPTPGAPNLQGTSEILPWPSPSHSRALPVLTFDDGILDEVHLLPKDGSQHIREIP